MRQCSYDVWFNVPRGCSEGYTIYYRTWCKSTIMTNEKVNDMMKIYHISTLLVAVVLCGLMVVNQGREASDRREGEGGKMTESKQSIYSEESTLVRLYSVDEGRYITVNPVIKADREWQQQLTPEQFRITRKKGTERPFANEYWNNHETGIYRCVGCRNDLFSSKTKFESGTGWPSFWAPVAEENIKTA